MASASSGSSHHGLTENQKRWLVAGIALNKILMPQIRPYVEQGIKTEYNNLKTSHNIDGQSTSGRLKKWPQPLKYENINGNDGHPKLSGGKYDYSLFDCRVASHVDFARLYVENYMAKFNAFDDHCDASAVVSLLGRVPVFSAAVKTAAGDVRMARNDWAHCVFSKWDQVKFLQSFTEMEQLVKVMALPIADEGKLLGDLKDWETKGNSVLFILARNGILAIKKNSHRCYIIYTQRMYNLCDVIQYSFLITYRSMFLFDDLKRPNTMNINCIPITAYIILCVSKS
ncbi:hypothetical protein OS493_026388 [Desmophyllum pertusum]|uniref:Uncharacterized protein n=1 Tax=Desmophyllum pertusum TaxID=174260 RepID=A0A9W9Z9T3_9CNID|nr:hypothetical protein OS493_026388 [Desmophyllum pertusum]